MKTTLPYTANRQAAPDMRRGFDLLAVAPEPDPFGDYQNLFEKDVIVLPAQEVHRWVLEVSFHGTALLGASVLQFGVGNVFFQINIPQGLYFAATYGLFLRENAEGVTSEAHLLSGGLALPDVPFLTSVPLSLVSSDFRPTDTIPLTLYGFWTGMTLTYIRFSGRCTME